jgi:hypothetical protein
MQVVYFIWKVNQKNLSFEIIQKHMELGGFADADL